jgi:hypothetical protein
MNELLTAVTSSIAASGAVVWLSKSWIAERLKNAIKHEYDVQLESHKAILKSQYDEKIETHKAQLKAQTDVENERLKSQLNIMAAERQVRFSGLHNKRADVISAIYALLVEAHWEGASFASPLQLAGEPSKREKYIVAWNALSKFYREFQKSRLYIPEHVCILIDPLVEDMRSKIGLYNIYLDYDGPTVLDDTYREKQKAWADAWRYFEKDFPKARRALEHELRRLLGDSSGAALEQLSSSDDEAPPSP